MNRFQITQEIIEELCKLETKKCIDFLKFYNIIIQGINHIFFKLGGML